MPCSYCSPFAGQTPLQDTSKNPKKFLAKEELSNNKYRAVSDFISGMTDRYAINLYNNIK